jgi:hypothetical protein
VKKLDSSDKASSLEKYSYLLSLIAVITFPLRVFLLASNLSKAIINP